MFGRLGKKTTEAVDKQIARCLEDMDMFGPDSEEYPKLLTQVERLNKLKAEGKANRLSRDTLVLVAGNLAGILIIVAYEQKHVFASKGLSHILKPKGR